MLSAIIVVLKHPEITEAIARRIDGSQGNSRDRFCVDLTTINAYYPCTD
ncbi:MAG: hypothetical protein AAFO87_00375 [Cyanobacteria bacterium J06607_6]